MRLQNSFTDAMAQVTAATNSTGYSASQAIIDVVTGAVGGRIGDAFNKSVRYGKIGTALPGEVARSNAMRDLGNNIAVSNISRNVLGNIAATVGGELPTSLLLNQSQGFESCQRWSTACRQQEGVAMLGHFK